MMSGCHDLALAGCTPEPLMAYLKALGVLRLVSEQKDPEARGWWKNDVFWLRSPTLFKGADTEAAKRKALTGFFLKEYQPTPIVAPWAGGSGFFRKDNKEAVEELRQSKASRVHLYAQVIEKVHAIIKDEKVGDKPKDQDKARLIRRYRRELPDDVVAWMDAAMVIREAGQVFAPLLGTGGNDGRLDFTQNFMQRIVLLDLHEASSANPQSDAWLEQALFAAPTTLAEASVGQFAPGRVGGPNATQGMEGDATDNPWDFVLMLEGTLLLAGAAVRRFGTVELAKATFPFAVDSVAAGFDSSAKKDGAESRGEIWLPLWTRPTSATELRQLFGEGRAEISGQPARTGTDFARAVAGLGVDRGIAGFTRLAFLKRSGKAFLATPMGRFGVIERREVDLLRQVDPWLDAFRRAAKDKNAPPRFGSALRHIDSAIFDFCKYGGPWHFQQILIALGQADRELTIAERFRDEKKLKPLAGLSLDWILAADDGSREFKLAQALASVHDAEGKIGPLRANLEAVDWKKRCRVWAEKDRSVVWNAGDLTTNLANVLDRRLMDGLHAGCKGLPLASRAVASLDVIAAFLDGGLDDRHIEDLLWGLMLIEQKRGLNRGQSEKKEENTDRLIPRTYALLKLLFLPRPLVGEPSQDGIRWRLAHESEEGIVIRPEPRILSLLRAGRIGEACRIAAQRLRVSGLPPIPGTLPDARTRDDVWSEFVGDHCRGERLAASLLIPIDSVSVNRLIQLICREQLEFTT
ncbi:MAG: type I-U CRISPR-associated protein Csx17 [Nitrospira sp.]|nr:type I-U CRISPR-associated protein Csx17 [Nitrospira sp.]